MEQHDDDLFAFGGPGLKLAPVDSICLSIEEADLSPDDCRQIGKVLRDKLDAHPRSPSGRVRRLELTRLHAQLLQWIALHPGRPIRQEAPRALVSAEQHGALRYWVLVRRIGPGRYIPTDLGERFLGGRARVPRWVDVRRDVVVRDSEDDDVGIDDL